MVSRRNVWLMAVALPLVVTLGYHFGWLGSIDYLNDKITDRFFLPRSVEAPVTIIAIDDRSLQAIGRWPWARSVHAELLDRLRPLKPAAVVFDVSFFESTQGAGDQALARAIKGMPIILAAEARDFSPPAARKILKPLDSFLSAGAQPALVNMTLDRDGVLRRFWHHYRNPDDQSLATTIGTLGVEGVGEYCSKPKGICAAIRDFWSKINPDFEGTYRIAFAGPPGHFSYHSYSDVIGGKVPAETLRNKIILIGATAPDLHDLFLVPTAPGSWMSGVEVHANIIETIWTKQFFREVGVGGNLLITLCWSLLVAWFFQRTPKINVLILATLLLMIMATVAVIIAFESRWIFNLIFIIVGISLTFVAELGYVYMVEGKQRRFLESVFKPYVSEKILYRIIVNPNALALGGEKRLITVLFADIRSFITIAEKTDPEVLGQVLNEYFQAMSKIILAEGGLIDKFIGDAIMAIWGAPLDDAQQAERACRVALKLVARSKELQVEFAQKGWPKIEIGIGINTGVAVVGNFGSRERFSYTAVGDTVNLASRLESANKEFGTNIIISEFTQQALPVGSFQYRSLGTVTVKGKEQRVGVFELVGA